MSNAEQTMPRAPLETCGRTLSDGTGARPRRSRIRFTVRAMSGAVSARVPARSKSTASMAPSVTARAQQVVHVHVAPQRIGLREGIVGHAREVGDLETRRAAEARELGGPDELAVLVRAARQQAQDVLGADDGEQERLGIAVDG